MNPLVERLGWVLVHSLWQFALVALLAGVIARAMRRSSSAARYGALVVAMAVMIVVPLATWFVLPSNARDDLASRRALAPGLALEVATGPGADAARLAGVAKFEDPTSDDAHTNDDKVSGTALAAGGARWSTPAASAVPLKATGGLTPSARQDEVVWLSRFKAALHPWLTWIMAVWSLGVVVCSLRPLLGWHTLWRLKRVGVKPVSDDVLAAMRRVTERLGLRRAVTVLQSTLAQVPVVVGYLRPVVLLPVSLMTSLPAEQLEAILAHELAHVRRHDFVVNLLQTLVETFFFYHPAVWWLSHQIRVEREHCCDDLVVASFGNRVEYGRALLAIEELRGRSTVLALGANDGSLLSRIRRIVEVRSDHATHERGPAALMTLALVGVVCALSMTWSLAAKDDAKKEPKPDRYVAELPNGVRVDFIGLAPMEKEPKTWWKPDGSPLSDVPKHGKETLNVTAHEVRRALIRVHGGGLSYLDVITPGMTNVRSDEAHGSGGPFVRLDGGYAFPPGQKTGRIEVGIATQPKSPVRRLDAKGRRIVPGRGVNSDSGVQGVIVVEEFETRRPIVVDVGGSDRIATDDDVTIEKVEQPPLWITKSNGKQLPETAEQKAENDERRVKTQVVWTVPKHWKSFDLEMTLIDIDGKSHQPSGRGFDFDTDEMRRRQINRGSVTFNVPLSRAAGFEYRTRRYQHWVTFDNVALNPGEMTDVKVQVESHPEPKPESKEVRFTDELRLELKRGSAHGGRWFFVDLDRGRIAKPPFVVEIEIERLPYFVTQPKEAELNEWLKQEGIDLILFSEAKPLGDGSGRMNQHLQTRSVRTNLAHLASGLQPRRDGSWTWKAQPSEVVAPFVRKDETTHVSGFVPHSSDGELRQDSPNLHAFRTAENVLGLFLLEQPNALKDEMTLRIVHVANATTPLADVQFATGDFVSGKNGPAEPPPGQPPGAKLDAWGPEWNGLRSRLVTVPTTANDESPDLSKSANLFARGDDVTLAVELQNVSDRPQTLIGVRHDAKGQPQFEGKFAPEVFAPHLFELEFTDANGQPVPRASRVFLEMSDRLSGALTHSVEPGKSLVVVLRPSRFYSPMDHQLPPGIYRARVRYHGPSDQDLTFFRSHRSNELRAKAWYGKVTSNTVTFSVANEAIEAKRPKLVWGPEENGLQAAIEFRHPPGATPTNGPPGTFPTKPEVSTIFHVKNVSDRTIKFVSETGRQGDDIDATDEAGKTKRLETGFFTGVPIMVRWTLKPGEVAELRATSRIGLIKKPGKYTLQASINFRSLVRNKGEGEDGFPKPDDYQQTLVTGDTPITIRARPPVVIPVSANGEIRGVLLDAETGEPIERAQVACEAFNNHSGKRMGSSTYTDDEGRYRLHVPAPGFYNVWLHEYQDKWMTAAADDGLFVDAGKVTASQMFLVNARKIVGTLVDSAGKPVRNPVVKCNSPARPESLHVHKMRAEPDGSFWFAVPPGRAYLYVDEESQQTKDNSTGGFRSAHAQVEVPVSSDVAPVMLSLQTSTEKPGDTEWLKRSTPGTQIVRRAGTQNVTGNIVDESGKPIAGAKLLRDDGSLITTNNKGEFRIETPKGIQLTLHAVAPCYHVWFGTPTAGDVLKIVLEQKQRPRIATAPRETAQAPNAAARSEAVFARKVSLDVKELPLREALAKLAQAARVPLKLDEPALTTAELDLDEPVTVAFRDVPLSQALGLLIDWNFHPGVFRELRGGALSLSTLEAMQERTAQALPDWLKPLYNRGLLANLDDDNHVISISASGALTDELLARLKTLPKLRELNLGHPTKITAAGLAHLAQLTALEKLTLSSINTTEERLGDEALKHIVGLKSLRELHLNECGTTDAGIRWLEELPQLTHLDVYQEGRLTDAAITSIAKLKRLKHLGLNTYVGSKELGWMRFSKEAIQSLAGLQDLEHLHLVGQGVSSETLQFPRLKSLSLGVEADDACAARIAECRQLQTLQLVFTSITDDGLKVIAALPELKRLNTDSHVITDTGIGHLKTLPKLDHLSLRVSHLTDASLEHIAKIKSLTRLDLNGSGHPGFVVPGNLPQAKFTVPGLLKLKALPNARISSATGGGGFFTEPKRKKRAAR